MISLVEIGVFCCGAGLLLMGLAAVVVVLMCFRGDW